ncbi:MAG: flagellin [Campylobacterota bacterium]|nr:flagellin [Campylobacterota bacterium]
MSDLSINSSIINPTVHTQNNLANTKVAVQNFEPKEYSDANNLKNIYVDSHVISNLNLKKEHTDKIKIEIKEQQESSPLKDVDYEQEVKDFSEKNIQAVEGNLAFAQANANPQKVEDLLT